MLDDTPRTGGRGIEVMAEEAHQEAGSRGQLAEDSVLASPAGAHTGTSARAHLLLEAQLSV